MFDQKIQQFCTSVLNFVNYAWCATLHGNKRTNLKIELWVLSGFFALINKIYDLGNEFSSFDISFESARIEARLDVHVHRSTMTREVQKSTTTNIHLQTYQAGRVSSGSKFYFACQAPGYDTIFKSCPYKIILKNNLKWFSQKVKNDRKSFPPPSSEVSLPPKLPDEKDVRNCATNKIRAVLPCTFCLTFFPM